MPFLGTNRLPTTICYQHPDGNLEALPLNQALQKLGMTEFSQTFWVDELPQLTWNAASLSALQILIDESTAAHTKMAIIDMPEGLGYEVVAIEPINKGTPILYSGKLLTQMPDNDNYLLSLPEVKDTAFKCVSPQQTGNLARLFAHACSEITLTENVAFNSENARTQVALPNFEKSFVKIANFFIPVLTALCDIPVGGRFRWNYGLGHFISAGITPRLFNKDTHQCLDPCSYYWKKTHLAFVCDKSFLVKQRWSLQEWLAHDHYAVISGEKTQKSYDTYIHKHYLVALLKAKPYLSTRLIVELEPPLLQDPTIKHVPKGKNIHDYLLETLQVVV